MGAARWYCLPESNPTTRYPGPSLGLRVCGLEALETLEASLLINHKAGCSRDASGSRWKHGAFRITEITQLEEAAQLAAEIESLTGVDPFGRE